MYLYGLLVGVFLHIAVLRKGELDLVAHKIFYCELFHILSVFLFSRCILTAGDHDATEASISFTSLYAMMHALGLLLSILVYRLFFHRTKHFPGPILAATSNFYLALSSLKKWRLYEDVQAMHAAYGDYVRVGPNQLSISDPAAISLIYSNPNCNRGPISNLSPRRYVFSFDRNKSTHQLRRGHWVRAFGAKAIHAYDGTIEKHLRSLEKFLDANQGGVINITDLIGFVSFDITFESVFGLDAGCVSNNRQHRLIHNIQGLKAEVQPIQHLPWVVSLGLINPYPLGHYAQMSRQSDALVKEQLNNVGTGDIREKREGGYDTAFKYFMDACRTFPDQEKALACLKGHSDLTLIAGWDNTANALVATLYHLSQSQTHLTLIREELEEKKLEITHSESSESLTSSDQSKRWAHKLSECTNLNAAMNEAMRLHPGLARGVQRQTPPTGLQIGSTFIPGDVVINVPHHTMSHDQRFFVDAETFRPERWTSDRGLVKDSRAFMPFGVGLSPCPGRLFALRIMRAVLAEIVLKWEFDLAPGVSPNVLLDRKFEKFNTGFGAVEMVFQRRI